MADSAAGALVTESTTVTITPNAMESPHTRSSQALCITVNHRTPTAATATESDLLIMPFFTLRTRDTGLS